MKIRFLKNLLLAVLLLFAIGVLASCNDNTNIILNYSTLNGGSISGNCFQYLHKGMDGSEVEAIANEGYYFTAWSDGLKDHKRQDLNNKADINVTARFEKLSFAACYTAGDKGVIQGSLIQSVKFGDYSEAVSAVADKGYMFIEWSDGVQTANRTDMIKDHLEVTAIFDIFSKTFSYDYHYATKDNKVKNVTLSYDSFITRLLATPKKENSVFGGWYSDKQREKLLTDENGKILIDKDALFYNENTIETLYAKWTPAHEVPVYKILLVFVEEIQATLKTKDKEDIEVNYKLSPLEREICELIPKQFERYLNECFYGVMTFQVDSYFTKEVMTTEHFDESWGRNRLMATDIPEVGPLLQGYRSVITTLNMNDLDEVLHKANGVAGTKFAAVHLESVLHFMHLNGNKYEYLLDANYEKWIGVLDTYFHEFAHTIEHEHEYYNFHEALWQGVLTGLRPVEATKLYLLNQAYSDGDKVGIPFNYWTGKDLMVYVNYVTDTSQGGRINGHQSASEKIAFGGEYEVTATANPGYKFVGWSDGILTATRKDINITSWLTVEAIFKKL